MVVTVYNQIEANKRKTLLIMVAFIVFIVGLTYAFVLALGYEGPGGLGIIGFTLTITGLINLVSYYFSDSLVLSVSGAKPIKEEDNPLLYNTIENLCIASGTPLPKVYLIEDPSPNAFATGRDPKHASLAATTGLLERLNKLELQGVISHELSHIKNYDTRVMTIVVVLVGMVAMMADLFFRMTFHGGGNRDRKGAGLFLLIGLVLAILSPIIAQLIKLSVSRRREFLADASGSLITRHPEGLASALLKISAYPQSLKKANNATAHLYIQNPFRGKEAKNWLTNLFSTHPPIEERVKALRGMVSG